MPTTTFSLTNAPEKNFANVVKAQLSTGSNKLGDDNVFVTPNGEFDLPQVKLPRHLKNLPIYSVQVIDQSVDQGNSVIGHVVFAERKRGEDKGSTTPVFFPNSSSGYGMQLASSLNKASIEKHGETPKDLTCSSYNIRLNAKKHPYLAETAGAIIIVLALIVGNPSGAKKTFNASMDGVTTKYNKWKEAKRAKEEQKKQAEIQAAKQKEIEDAQRKIEEAKRKIEETKKKIEVVEQLSSIMDTIEKDRKTNNNLMLGITPEMLEASMEMMSGYSLPEQRIAGARAFGRYCQQLIYYPPNGKDDNHTHPYNHHFETDAYISTIAKAMIKEEDQAVKRALFGEIQRVYQASFEKGVKKPVMTSNIMGHKTKNQTSGTQK